MDGFAGDGESNDGGKPDDGTGASDASSTSDASEAGARPVCTNGRIGGIVAFDATPTGAKATACGIANALVADGQVTGLDADDYGGTVLLAGRDTHACVGVEFEAPVKTVYVRVAAGPNACGRPCLGTECGDGDYAEVFTAPARGGYQFLRSLTTGPALAEQSLPVPSTTRVVLVCRGGWSMEKDDVLVDSITAACQ
jgi:hypothetical protein